MNRRWMTITTFATAFGLMGVFLGFAAQGPPPGKGGGGSGGSSCSIVTTDSSDLASSTINPRDNPLFGPDFGRAIAATTLATGNFLVVTTSANNRKIEVFTLDPTTGSVVHVPGATIDLDLIPSDGLGEVRTFALGDIDGDGVPDIVAGDPFVDNGQGAAHVFLSQNGVLGYTANAPLARPAGAQRFGGPLAVGNVDYDMQGQNEVVVGAAGQVTGPPGQVFVYEFDTTGPSFGVVETLSVGEKGDGFGRHVGVADVTGDDIPDLIVGASHKDDGKNKDAGVTFVYYDAMDREKRHQLKGNRGEGLNLRVAADMITSGTMADGYQDILAVNILSARTRRGVIFRGPFAVDRNADSEFELPIDSNHSGGYGPSSAGDVNDDLLADVLVGAVDAFDSNGAVYLYLSGPDQVGNLVPASQCLILRSPEPTAIDFGWSVAALPGSNFFLVGEPRNDLNRDGIEDGQLYVFDRTLLP